MVRLKVINSLDLSNVDLFQFQNGSIKNKGVLLEAQHPFIK